MFKDPIMTHGNNFLPAEKKHIVKLVDNQKLVIEFHPARNDLILLERMALPAFPLK